MEKLYLICITSAICVISVVTHAEDKSTLICPDNIEPIVSCTADTSDAPELIAFVNEVIVCAQSDGDEEYSMQINGINESLVVDKISRAGGTEFVAIDKIHHTKIKLSYYTYRTQHPGEFSLTFTNAPSERLRQPLTRSMTCTIND